MAIIKAIAVDVMGGDLGTKPIIAACMQFAQIAPNIKLVLVGDRAQITPYLPLLNPSNIELCHTPDFIKMIDAPTLVVKSKLDYSLRLALQLVARGECDACLTPANTGALVLLARQVLGMQKDILRPALAVMLPTLLDECCLLDVGATTMAKAKHLQQFAYLGANFVAKDFPKIFLLNIGTEEHKGTAIIKEAAQMLKQDKSLNFGGFIESGDLFKGLADIVICDGLLGNLFLKTSAAAAEFMLQKLADILPYDLKPNNHNAAILLGVNGLVIKAHGASDALSFCAALKYVAKLKTT